MLLGQSQRKREESARKPAFRRIKEAELKFTLLIQPIGNRDGDGNDTKEKEKKKHYGEQNMRTQKVQDAI